MPTDVKPAADIAAKWARVTPQRQADYEAAATVAGGRSPIGYRVLVYLSWVEILVNFALRFAPSVLTMAMIATEMPAAIRPYSMAVAPESSLRKRAKVFMAEAP